MTYELLKGSFREKRIFFIINVAKERMGARNIIWINREKGIDR